MTPPDAAVPLPWIASALDEILGSTRAHAWLLHGPQGVGQFELALQVAQGWLCEADPPVRRACGVCVSCRLVHAHTHPDLLVLVPEALQVELGWGGGDTESASGSARGAKAKPSKDIKVEAVREAVAFAQLSSARARAKVVVLHPAERMNAIAANSLLKTLEEPAGLARFVLSCAAPEALLPTVRSRCQSRAIALPPTAQALEWLAQHGVVQPPGLLAGAGGQPQLALEWSRDGIDAALWAALPGAVQRGHASAVAGWPVPRVLDALQKLCHDAACVACGAAPRYFASADVPRGASVAALLAWMGELQRIARHAEHPWNVALLAESLVLQGQRALHVPGPAPGPRAGARGRGAPG